MKNVKRSTPMRDWHLRSSGSGKFGIISGGFDKRDKSTETLLDECQRDVREDVETRSPVARL